MFLAETTTRRSHVPARQVVPYSWQKTPTSGPKKLADDTAATVANCNGMTTFSSSGKWTPWIPTYRKTASSTPTRTCILGIGNNGSAVWAVQKPAQGYYRQNLGPSGLDSSYGSYTAAAVKAIQGSVGVYKDGIYGPKTHNGSSGNATKTGMFFWYDGSTYRRDLASA
ncbi:MAG: peptidoglycan-binding protein [Bifidobacteriaceae bacterium]|jgi:peptidoglycan hydrolase-like protein with peptidoglycan-binding domain|nr:peptidoglycan-binding protein [Bifidobacteriaceae bacterium]